ncbi:pectate lyase [Bimuria novae-zelandiae CBS 107.79]|uniref:Pectate lyase n=1 Tax=Bimuria novae-zelandiae CBS 107.79 TaxID=1447943 RepID=A0A6A5UTG9_9PLEO|nr:pectate lyase [Bimuria novae-zelandiae CBS 107.79]
MRSSVILAFVPAVLGCADPSSNSCASFIKANVASCGTFLSTKITTTTNLPAWATACSNKPSAISKECTSVKTSAASSAAPITTSKATPTTAGSGTTPTGITTTLPTSQGAVSTSQPIPVSAGQNFDGGMKLYDRYPKVCAEQDETGEADTIFILEEGATISNVIIGPGQAEGIHYKGTCTVNNVWWKDVCEDAITFKQSSGTSYINGGGAFAASDKIIQFNGFGTVNVKNFYAQDYGKVSRSCGNCSNNGGARHLIFDNVIARNGGAICGINGNYGDSCTITNTCQNSGKNCDNYKGNNSGAEPSKVSSGNDGQYCKVASSFTSSC